MFLVFKIEENKKKQKDWLNRQGSCSDMSLFNGFKIIVGILFDSLLTSRFHEELIWKTSVLF